MNIMNPLKTCRLCLRNLGGKGIDCTKITEIRDNILSLFQITITTADSCKLVCESCFENVMGYYAFKNTVQYCQTFIKDYVNVKKKVMDVLDETRFQEPINLSDEDENLENITSDTMLSVGENMQSARTHQHSPVNIDFQVENIIAYMNQQDELMNHNRATQTQSTDVLNEMTKIVQNELKKKKSAASWKTDSEFMQRRPHIMVSLPPPQPHNSSSSSRDDSLILTNDITLKCNTDCINDSLRNINDELFLTDSVRQKLKKCKKCKVVCQNLALNDFKNVKSNNSHNINNARRKAGNSKRRASVSSYDLDKVNFADFKILSPSESTDANPCPKIIIARRKTLSISDLLTLRNVEKKTKKPKINSRVLSNRDPEKSEFQQFKCESPDSNNDSQLFNSKSGRSSFLFNCNLDTIVQE